MRASESSCVLPLLLAMSISACSLASLDALQRSVPDSGNQDAGRSESDDVSASTERDARVESVESRDAAVADAAVADAAVAADAAEPALDGAFEAVDAGAVDAGAVDASADAASALADAGLPVNAWCPDVSPRPLCDDFESGSLSVDGRFDWSWFETLGSPPGAGTLSNPSGLPGGRGFRAAVGPTSKEQSVTLAKQLPSTLASVRMAFDMTSSIGAQSPTQSSGLVIAKLEQQVADAYPGVSLEAVPTGILLHVENVLGGTTIVASDQLGALPSSGLTRVQLDVTFGSQGSVRLSYDGVLQLEKTHIQVGSPAAEGTVFLLGLYTESAPASFVFYDNVALSFQ